jgi:hypothetical protein
VADRSGRGDYIAPLAKAPDGLLGALDLKTLGRNPGVFGDVLQPSIETIDFYMLRNRIHVGFTSTFVAVNTNLVWTAATGTPANYVQGGLVTVPQQEVWRVKTIAMQNTRVAGDAALLLEADVFIRRPANSQNVAIFVAQWPAVVATDLIRTRTTGYNPFFLGEGDFFVIRPTTTQTAAGSGYVLELDIDVMQSG